MKQGIGTLHFPVECMPKCILDLEVMLDMSNQLYALKYKL